VKAAWSSVLNEVGIQPINAANPVPQNTISAIAAAHTRG